MYGAGGPANLGGERFVLWAFCFSFYESYFELSAFEFYYLLH